MDILNNLFQQMPPGGSIIGREKYIQSAVLLPLLKISGEYSLLFQIRSPHIRQGSEICFPGGKVDSAQDETTRSTAIRETVEELGIPAQQVKSVRSFGTIIAPAGMIIDAYIGVLDIHSLDQLSLNRDEVESVFTLPLATLKDLNEETYSLRLEIHSTETDTAGQKRVLFPVTELGLPSRYVSSWGGYKYPVYVYATENGTIWGITAEFVREFKKYL